jgi:ADP-ribose pyrophosphatase YjhB (NUDIX family)
MPTPTPTPSGDEPVDLDVIVGCAALVRDAAGRYLLVQESKPSARGRYNLPAGKLERDETLAEAAIREAREETGLRVAVEHLVGFYHCPRTSEGYAVLNVVFAAHAVGGTLATSDEHPDVRFFYRDEIADLQLRLRLRGTHIPLAIEDHERGQRLSLSMLQVVAASPLPH